MSNALKSTCPIHFALQFLGDRWSFLLIRDLLLKNRSSYGEFLKSPEGISTNILANRLQRLESAEIINKRQDPENRSRFIYSLTPKGEDLTPLIIELMVWGGKYNADGPNLDAYVKQLRERWTLSQSPT